VLRHQYQLIPRTRRRRYGAHLFHTKFERVWDYVQEHSEWIPFDHRVKGMVPDKDGVKKLVPIPPTQVTFSLFLSLSLSIYIHTYIHTHIYI